MTKFSKLGGYSFLLACLIGCKSTDKTGKGTLESSSSSGQTSLQLSQVAVHYPSPDPLKDKGPAKPIFPAAFATHSGVVMLMRDIKIIVAEPCKGQISVNETAKEVGCNFGRGHFYVFAKFDGDKLPLEKGVLKPVEGIPEYIQKLKFDAKLASLKPTQDKSVYSLTITAPK
jgi:hypothetical protein